MSIPANCNVMIICEPSRFVTCPDILLASKPIAFEIVE